jgi:hypothetical protein
VSVVLRIGPAPHLLDSPGVSNWRIRRSSPCRSIALVNLDTEPHERLVTLGVDTDADIHFAVALDHLGGMLGAIQLLE